MTKFQQIFLQNWDIKISGKNVQIIASRNTLREMEMSPSQLPFITGLLLIFTKFSLESVYIFSFHVIVQELFAQLAKVKSKNQLLTDEVELEQS